MNRSLNMKRVVLWIEEKILQLPGRIPPPPTTSTTHTHRAVNRYWTPTRGSLPFASASDPTIFMTLRVRVYTAAHILLTGAWSHQRARLCETRRVQASAHSALLHETCFQPRGTALARRFPECKAKLLFLSEASMRWGRCVSNCWFRHDITIYRRERERGRELHGQCQGKRLTEFTGLSIMDRKAFFFSFSGRWANCGPVVYPSCRKSFFSWFGQTMSLMYTHIW